MPGTSEFSRPVDLERLGAGREEVAVTASAKECQALAERLGLVAVRSLSAELSVEAKPTLGLVTVEGRLKALVTQTCVITLAPFDQRLEESFRQDYSLTAAEEDEDPESLDLDQPEPLPQGGLDLGEEVAQQLSLALDPYPRAPGAELPASAEDSVANPFAALARLKQGTGGESGGEEG